MKTLQPVHRVLTGSAMHTLLEQVYLRQKLDQQMRGCLDAGLAAHVVVADLRGTTLILHATSPAWATRVRYLGSQLLRCLQQHENLRHTRKIQVRVAPPVQDRTSHNPSRQILSSENAQLLQDTARHISHPALAHALRRLAGKKTR